MSEEREAIAKLIAAGDDAAAFARLRDQLGWPRGRDLAAPDLPMWIAMLGELASRRGAEPLAVLADGVVRDPDSPDRIYELGYALIDAGAPTIAATMLWRCLALVGESEEVLCELVSALEHALAYPDATEILGLHANLRSHSFMCQYLYGFNAAMAGCLAITREVVVAIQPDSPETETMKAVLAAMLARADRLGDAVRLDVRDLRGWHYVLTGGLLVHQSPYGFEDPMHGRYAWLGDSLERIATGLLRVKQLTAGLELPCIYAPPGRDHEIIGHAASAMLGLPLAPWPTIGVPAPGLIVAYDVATIARSHAMQLANRRVDQVYFAHASPWTVDQAVAPDVTTLLYQTLVPPWDKQLQADPATHQLEHAAPDERSAAELGALLAAAPSLPDEEAIADDPAGWERLVARAWPPTPGPRSRLWAGGPVPSNRFP